MRPTLAQVIAQHAPAYRAAYAARMPEFHLRALERLENCGTEDAGRVFYQCPQCEDWQMVPASCGHRACNACGHHKTLAWQARQEARLLPVNYALVTFTIPAEFRSLFRAQQRLCYDLLFQESYGTLRDIAADPEHLGGDVGLTGVLHTWTRDLRYHPHIHYIMPAGAWKDGKWVHPKALENGSNYFLNVHVLATRMRNRMMKVIQREHPELKDSLGAKVWRKRWNVQIQPVGKGDTALGYLARYVQKSAIDASRIIHTDPQGVTIGWTDRKSGVKQTKKLAGNDFLHRFLQHVLPTGLTRVRHFGFLSAAAKRKFQAIRTYLQGDPCASARSDAASPPPPDPSDAAQPSDPTQPLAADAPPRKHCCPRCNVVMKFGEFWPANKAGRGPPGYDPKPGEAVQRLLGLKFEEPAAKGKGRE
ncbi:MAG: transposase [Verrucomicrobiaceae bacterium]